MHLASICIPIYKEIPSKEEINSLLQLNAILKGYNKIIVAPRKIDLKNYTSIIQINEVHFLDPMFFESISGYSHLMLSEVFYKLFLKYEYVLIYQTDAWVFEDCLNYWCEQKYDYVGAPWVGEPYAIDFYSKLLSRESRVEFLKRKIKYVIDDPNITVGNGGFSLRKVSSCLRMIRQYSDAVNTWITRKIHEDTFWGVYAGTYDLFFKVPKPEVAMKFSMETSPEICYELNGKELPFGCHAWEKYNPDFWSNFIPRFTEVKGNAKRILRK